MPLISIEVRWARRIAEFLSLRQALRIKHATPVEAGDKTQSDRVSGGNKDDRYNRGRRLRRQRCGDAGGYDYRYAAAYEIG